MLMKKFNILLLFIVAGTCGMLFGQTNTNSPYSRFGIGELASQGFSINNGMGGIGIGLQKPNTINYLNPASYSSQDTMSFLFDFGLMGKFSSYKTYNDKNVSNTANLDHLAIAFPITKWLHASIGVKPYSNVGYNIFKTETDVDVLDELGVNSMEQIYQGNGNINSFFIGTSIQPAEWLSLGINAFYLFGNIDYESGMQFPNDLTMAATFASYKDIYRSLYFNLGAQFKIPVNDKSYFIVGGTFGPGRDSKIERQSFVRNEYPTNALIGMDTLIYEKGVERDFSFPTSYGFGLSYQMEDRLLVGVDYSTEKWSEAKYTLSQNSLIDIESYNFGMEYTPNPTAPKGFLNKVNYRAGFHYMNDYLKIDDFEAQKYGVTLGLGIPFKYSKSKVNVSAEFGKMGTTDNGMIMENYSMFTFSLTLYDFWFFKRKFN